MGSGTKQASDEREPGSGGELTPMEEIMALVGAETPQAALAAVRHMHADLERLGSLAVVPVVLAGGRPLFAQLPPSEPQHRYPPEALEMVRDALVEASVALRAPLARSRAGATRGGDDPEPA